MLPLTLWSTVSRAEPAWIDPAFGATRWSHACGGAPVEATAWFDGQVLGPGDAYARRTAELAEARRRPLREETIAALKAASAASLARALPALTELEGRGLLKDCHAHWIVDAVTCTLPKGDPAVLAQVPGVTDVFRRPPVCAKGAPEAGPREVTETVPVAEPFTPGPATWNLGRLRIPDVWRLGYTGKGVLVAVQDTGFRLDVPPITATLWRNPGEVPGNGIDDEQDGYVDDVHGFAFERGDAAINTPHPRPERPIHGDAVAGVIAGRTPSTATRRWAARPTRAGRRSPRRAPRRTPWSGRSITTSTST
ncbi:MAG: S8 family serine peptidase [Myxococcota bacterium]